MDRLSTTPAANRGSEDKCGYFNNNYRRDDERTLFMRHDKKTSRYSNTGSVNTKKLRTHSNTIVYQMRVVFTRLAVWLAVVGGAIC